MRPEAFITIVSGLPRSGTSLMMQMLRAGGMHILADDVRPGDESNPNGYYEFEPVKRLASDATWVKKAEGAAVKVIVQLLEHLPDEHQYKVILMQREIDEVIESQATMLSRQGFTRPAVNAVTLAATFRNHWNRAHEAMLCRPNIEALVVNYHEILNSPAREVARIAGFLSRPDLDRDAMADVVDPRLYRTRLSRE